jgi:hypothetical protein
MQIGSKVAIYKCELIEPPKGDKFYKVKIVEKVYNPKKTKGGNWHDYFVEAYIFDLSLDLEPAKFDLNVNKKDKYSYDNISNPEKSVIRVLDFKFEKHQRWWGGVLQKDEHGKPIYDEKFFIYKIADGTKVWRSDDGKYKVLERKIEAQKNKIAEQKKKNLEKDVHYNKIIREIRSKITQLERENKKLKQVIEKQNKFVSDAKIMVKEANKETMVIRRKNTIANNEIQKTLKKVEAQKQKVAEAKQQVKEIKKMKKQQIINQAEEFNVDFDDL